jgi:hypothetical protein
MVSALRSEFKAGRSEFKARAKAMGEDANGA